MGSHRELRGDNAKVTERFIPNPAPTDARRGTHGT